MQVKSRHLSQQAIDRTDRMILIPRPTIVPSSLIIRLLSDPAVCSTWPTFLFFSESMQAHGLFHFIRYGILIWPSINPFIHPCTQSKDAASPSNPRVDFLIPPTYQSWRSLSFWLQFNLCSRINFAATKNQSCLFEIKEKQRNFSAVNDNNWNLQKFQWAYISRPKSTTHHRKKVAAAASQSY